MPDYRRWFRGGGTYFFTVVTFNRPRIFRSSPARASLHRAIAEVRGHTYQKISLDRISGIYRDSHKAHCHFDRNPDEVGMQWRNLSSSADGLYNRRTD
ncbi:MAG: hypothetical protein ACYTFQ_10075, partial [Planctomycetota bacterium]